MQGESVLTVGLKVSGPLSDELCCCLIVAGGEKRYSQRPKLPVVIVCYISFILLNVVCLQGSVFRLPSAVLGPC